MPQDPIFARPTAIPAQSHAFRLYDPGGLLPSEGVSIKLRQKIINLALEHRATILSQGTRISLELATREVLVQAQVASARHPDDLPQSLRCFGDPTAPKLQWRKNYVLAAECRGRPVWLAPRGTDYMPVRCLVTPRFGDSRRDVRVLTIGDLQVVTEPTLHRLKQLALAQGLVLRNGFYWPKSSWLTAAH